jgi:hypothetical protein
LLSHRGVVGVVIQVLSIVSLLQAYGGAWSVVNWLLGEFVYGPMVTWLVFILWGLLLDVVFLATALPVVFPLEGRAAEGAVRVAVRGLVETLARVHGFLYGVVLILAYVDGVQKLFVKVPVLIVSLVLVVTWRAATMVHVAQLWSALPTRGKADAGP